ncbi:MAG: hypothetical protein OXC62_00310 [Aestuariivita sp.]|nr:hypothetical protein [Aestuariivita sp.]
MSQIVDVTGELEWVQKDLTLTKILHDLLDVFPLEKWKAPVIVAINEAQLLSDDVTPQFLQSIHDTSSGLPLTLVLAGLSQTKDRIENIGITHGVTTHNFYSLNLTERNELLNDFCKKFEVDVKGYEPELQALVEPTEGWPRHLHFMLQALDKEFLRPKAQWPMLSGSKLQTMQCLVDWSITNISKVRYYRV